MNFLTERKAVMTNIVSKNCLVRNPMEIFLCGGCTGVNDVRYEYEAKCVRNSRKIKKKLKKKKLEKQKYK